MTNEIAKDYALFWMNKILLQIRGVETILKAEGSGY